MQPTMTGRPDASANAMTIDVEDYFQVSAFDASVSRSRWDEFESRVVRNTDRLLELFAGSKVRATFFVLGWVAERYPALVARIASAGHEVASHGFGHRLIYEQTPDEFRADLRQSRAALMAAAQVAVSGYRAPSFSVTARSLWALDIIHDEGFRYDASIFPIRHDRYGIPVSPRHPYVVHRAGGQLLEVPASTVRCGPLNLPIGGGGYFRILPYGWTRWGIARTNRVEDRAAIFYLHPWEIDPDQPRLRASLLGSFRHYRNLRATESRLHRLLGEFAFGRMIDVLNQAPSTMTLAPFGSPLPYVW